MTQHRHVVLLVDGDADMREAFATLIGSTGFDVVDSHSGGEALARLRGGLACCLVVLDWWLPDMTGGEFLRALRADAKLARIPVALCSGDARVQTEASALGAHCFMLKPIDPEHLLDLVVDHCGQGSPHGAASSITGGGTTFPG